MPKTPTMTLPERVHEALRKKAKEEFEQEPSDYLRAFLITARDNNRRAFETGTAAGDDLDGPCAT